MIGHRDKLRVGIIGAGTWGSVHGKIYRSLPQADLAAIADLDRQKAEALADQLGGGIRVAADHRELLQDESIQAVSVVVPDHLHRQVILDAVQSGKHVLIEKPLTNNLADARTCTEAMRKGGKTYMVNFHMRWMLPFYRAHELIRAGDIGEPRFAHFEQSNTIGFVTETLRWSGQSNALWFLGIHSVDMLQWLFGRRIRRVYCVSEKKLLLARGLDTEDFFASTLSFEGGGEAFLENSWIIPSAHPSIALCTCKIVGTEGRLSIDLLNNQGLRVTRGDKAVSDVNLFGLNQMEDGYAGSPAHSIAHFVNSTLREEEPLVSLEDGLSSVAVISSLIESASRREPVDIDAPGTQ